MATTGPLADFGRLPPQRKVAVFAVIGAVLGLLYFQFVFKPLKQSVEDAENSNASMSAQNKKLEGDIPKFAALRAKMQELKKIIEDNQKALPTEAELPEFFETLNRKVIEAGVDVRRWDYRSEKAVESFVKAPVDIEITGTYMQIKRFFASLVQKDVGPPTGMVANEGPTEDRERIVSIEDLKLSNPTVVNHEIVLTAKFTAATFRQEAPPAPAAPPPGAAGPGGPGAGPGGPGAGSGSAAGSGVGSGSGAGSASPSAGSGAKPLPPAATPAGAKARVEQSLEKGAAQNRNAIDGATGQTPNPDRLKGGI